MNKKLVLVVEDRPEIRKLLRLTLSINDMEVHEADSGESGIKMAKALRPGCVIMDVMMPGEIDGYQACRKIKDDPQTRNIPIVMLTARGQVSDLAEGQLAGANAYLVKPFSPLQLLDTVQKCLHGQSVH